MSVVVGLVVAAKEHILELLNLRCLGNLGLVQESLCFAKESEVAILDRSAVRRGGFREDSVVLLRQFQELIVFSSPLSPGGREGFPQVVLRGSARHGFVVSCEGDGVFFPCLGKDLVLPLANGEIAVGVQERTLAGLKSRGRGAEPLDAFHAFQPYVADVAQSCLECGNAKPGHRAYHHGDRHGERKPGHDLVACLHVSEHRDTP